MGAADCLPFYSLAGGLASACSSSPFLPLALDFGDAFASSLAAFGSALVPFFGASPDSALVSFAFFASSFLGFSLSLLVGLGSTFAGFKAPFFGLSGAFFGSASSFYVDFLTSSYFFGDSPLPLDFGGDLGGDGVAILLGLPSSSLTTGISFSWHSPSNRCIPTDSNSKESRISSAKQTEGPITNLI